MASMKDTPITAQTALPPSLADIPENTRPLADALTDAAAQHTDIDCAYFTGDSAVGCGGLVMEFSKCTFDHCTLGDWAYRRLCFVDCVFDHCDMSGLRLENVTFQRVRFLACRLTGAELLNASLSNVLFEGCAADYFALSESKLNRVFWSGCRLHESLWQDVKLTLTAFDTCDFTGAQFRYMPMEGQNMATCVLDSIQIDPHDLRGMKVTALQGLMFCSLLGLIIQD